MAEKQAGCGVRFMVALGTGRIDDNNLVFGYCGPEDGLCGDCKRKAETVRRVVCPRCGHYPDDCACLCLCHEQPATQNRPETVDAAPPTHTAAGRFAPGNCANPGGRPKRVKEIEDEIVATFGPKAAEVMTALFEKAARGNVRAAEVFLDRVLGKARVRAELSGPGGGPIPHAGDVSRMTSAEKRERLQALMVKAMSEAAAVAAGEATPEAPGDDVETP